MTAETPPSDGDVLAALRLVATTRALRVHPRVRPYFVALGYDVQSVCELLAECEPSELIANEPDDGGRNDRIAIVEIAVEGEPLPFYVKIALHLPEMSTGLLLSFKLRS
jgi:hypothetical protein